MISFSILSRRFILKREELSDAREVTITIKEHGPALHFYKDSFKITFESFKYFKPVLSFLLQNK